MRNFIWAFLLFFPILTFSQGSIGSLTGDESMFYAQTKQVNQFFLRFNGEEDVQGKRYYPGNPGYRELKARKKYLNMLFDNSSPVISPDAKFVFIEDALNKKNPAFLDFYAKGWFADQ